MSLSVYHQKRSFGKTPEPKGAVKKTTGALHFVVQQHAASHLHYDFRLEMRGVLKSWAVPKGPSMNPEVKRLAMMVEDHPYDYRDFEGIIPEGNYGAGTVIVWDEGTYEPADATVKNMADQEKELMHQLHQGKLKFVLHGKKLKGSFALVKATSRGENAWLLMKLDDRYATDKEVALKNKSVQSNLTLEQIAKTSRHTWQSNKKTTAKTTRKTAAASGYTTKQTGTAAGLPEEVEMLVRKGVKAPFPADLRPMLATRVDKAFDHPGWLYEIKWDGYRALSYLRNGKVEIRSRNNISFNEKFEVVKQALEALPFKAVLDGEITAMDEEGKPSFQQLQGYMKYGKKARLVYAVFDLLWYNGRDYRDLPLEERKSILAALLPRDNDVLQYSDHVQEQGIAFFRVALERGLEGVMAKKADSIYTDGSRSKSWLKIRNNQFTEAIVCGFTEARNSRKYFGAVVLGRYKGSTLEYIGHSGSGINDRDLKTLYNKFQPLITNRCPFKTKPKTNMPVTWLKPVLVCEVKYTEWTDENSLRHPIFMGLREDKTAANEKNEQLVKAPKASRVAKDTQRAGETPPAAAKPASKNKSSRRRKQELIEPGLKKTVVTLRGHELKLNNLDKLYWPEDGITKRDMLNYYHGIMPYLLPYMKNRPQSLNRFPDGIQGASFYQKNVEGKVADWITTFPYHSESDQNDKQFFVCTDEASLLYIATLGCIEMNPWHSRIQSPDLPDWCVIDLDPDKNSFDEVVKVAQEVKKVLDQFAIPSYPKTSGATGMHIYIPLGAQYTYEQSRLFAQLLVTLVQERTGRLTSLERTPAKRKGKIYLDFLQNRTIQTIAAPYSLRPRPGATLSTPLHWDEVKKGLSPAQFTIHTIWKRLQEVGDLFAPVLEKGIDLAGVLGQMAQAGEE